MVPVFPFVFVDVVVLLMAFLLQPSPCCCRGRCSPDCYRVVHVLYCNERWCSCTVPFVVVAAVVVATAAAVIAVAAAVGIVPTVESLYRRQQCKMATVVVFTVMKGGVS